ncbi:MAG: DUF3137 domain-containing protein [Woeseiaceae bacterium]|nr:DUF3137 domain-containing protein [Woeseiaceae bacterium]
MMTETVFDSLESQRVAALRAFWLTALICVFLLPLAALPLAGGMFVMVEHPPDTTMSALAERARAFLQPYASPFFLGALVWLLGGMFLTGRYFVRHGRQPVWDYVRNFKAVVLNHVCEHHFAGLSYDPKGYVGYDEFDATNLFAYTSDEYRSEDYFSGRCGKTDIHFAEVIAKRARKRFSDGSLETYYDVFFRGLVFVADFHKHFHSSTRLVPRGEKLKRVRGEQPVTVEDPEFEEVFATVSTDQIDARYVLSTAMIRRFVDLNKRFPGMRALFRNDKLVLALPRHRDLFEPSLYRRAQSSAQIDEFVRDIKSLLQIVDELNLNTRIWSKR